jgi:hypothetical protein
MKTFGKYLEEKNKGLWDNIHAKRKRGEKMRKPGSKGAPTDADFKSAQEESADLDEAKIGDKIKFRNIRTKRMKTGIVKKVDIKNGQKRYEVEGGKLIYDQDLEESLDITEISLDMLTKKANKFDKTKKDLEAMKARLAGKPSLAKEETQLDEASRRKGAPKMKGDSIAIQRAKDAELNKALGRTKTGRKKPVRQMTSTQRSLAQLRGESVQSADKKPEKYVKPDGKVAFRMIRTDKNVVDKDA